MLWKELKEISRSVESYKETNQVNNKEIEVSNEFSGFLKSFKTLGSKITYK
jgi:hypothetical protein